MLDHSTIIVVIQPISMIIFIDFIPISLNNSRSVSYFSRKAIFIQKYVFLLFRVKDD